MIFLEMMFWKLWSLLYVLGFGMSWGGWGSGVCVMFWLGGVLLLGIVFVFGECMLFLIF